MKKVSYLLFFAFLISGCSQDENYVSSIEETDSFATRLEIIDGKQIKYEVSDESFTNPHKGIVTFNQTNHDQYSASIAYYRIDWKKIEPYGDEKYNMVLINDIFNKVKASGQKIALRIKAIGDESSVLPKWMHGDSRYTVKYTNGKYFPKFDSPYFLLQVEQLLKKLGEYDGHELIDHIDIGIVGQWGEWHFSDILKKLNKDTVFIQPASKKRIIDAHFNAFRKTPLVALINDKYGLDYAIAKGAGWRADSWGDYFRYNTTWSHMLVEDDST